MCVVCQFFLNNFFRGTGESIRTVAAKFGLKRSTLHDGLRTGQLQFRLVRGSGRPFTGRKPTFSIDEEKRIAARYYTNSGNVQLKFGSLGH